MRTQFLKWSAAGALAGAQLAAGDAAPPNIVFILADDLGWQDVGFMGSQWFETPNLDRLAKESLVFNQAYMYPNCTPSRAALLTGKQSFRTEIYGVSTIEAGTADDNIFSRTTVGLEHEMYAGPLHRAGYHLIHVGKWHVVGRDPLGELAEPYPFQQADLPPVSGDMSWVAAHKTPEIQKYYPTGRGFDENVGGTWWGDPAKGQPDGRQAPGGGYVAPFYNPFIEEHEPGEWLTDRLTSEAIRFMKEHRDGPFFINLDFHAGHRPSVARSPERLKHYLAKPTDPETGQGIGSHDEIAAYATMVEAIDENVQRIVDALDELGLRENTVVIFTSDNGANDRQSGTHNLRSAKGSVYEGGLRVPLLVSWPGVVSAGKTEVPVAGLDWFPTFLDLAGMRETYTGVLDGDSLLLLLKGQAFPERSLFWHVASTCKNQPCSIIRKGDWKLIQFLKEGNVELYNLREDLKESRNLAISHPEVAQRLVAELTDWRRKNQVPLPPSSCLTD